MFMPKTANLIHIFKLIYFFSLLSLFLSIAENYLWDFIPFISDKINNKELKSGFSSVYRFDEIRVFGVFEDAAKNGLVLIFGLLYTLELLFVKITKVKILLLLLFILAIVFTNTRNIYLVSIFSIISWLLIGFFPAYIRGNRVWYTTILLYVLIVAASSISALIEGAGSLDMTSFTGNSTVQSRVISWNVIVNEYFFENFFSLHTIFGYGLFQFSTANGPDVSYWLIDNSILMIYLTSGLLGVCFYIAWLDRAMKTLLRHYKYTISKVNNSQVNILKITIVYLMTNLLNGALNVNFMFLYSMLPILVTLTILNKGGKV
jgi:hypothetical protein